MRELDALPRSQGRAPALHELHIELAGFGDLPGVRAAYAHARAIQTWEGATVWPEFSDESIAADIEGGSLYRVMDGEELVGVFSVAYDDAAIWGALERGEHVYLHRIARAEAYSGRGLVRAVLTCARAHCEALGRTGLRLDTWANNASLIAYYAQQGFRVIGRRQMGFDPQLPPHYHGNEYALLEELEDPRAHGRSKRPDAATKHGSPG
jgi:ribosomal protein S18 acetylase RimI-like enzyme